MQFLSRFKVNFRDHFWLFAQFVVIVSLSCNVSARPATDHANGLLDDLSKVVGKHSGDMTIEGGIIAGVYPTSVTVDKFEENTLLINLDTSVRFAPNQATGVEPLIATIRLDLKSQGTRKASFLVSYLSDDFFAILEHWLRPLNIGMIDFPVLPVKPVNRDDVYVGTGNQQYSGCVELICESMQIVDLHSSDGSKLTGKIHYTFYFLDSGKNLYFTINWEVNDDEGKPIPELKSTWTFKSKAKEDKKN